MLGDSDLLRVNREFELTVFSRFRLSKAANNTFYVYQTDMLLNGNLNENSHINAKEIN